MDVMRPSRFLCHMMYKEMVKEKDGVFAWWCQNCSMDIPDGEEINARDVDMVSLCDICDSF